MAIRQWMTAAALAAAATTTMGSAASAATVGLERITPAIISTGSAFSSGTLGDATFGIASLTGRRANAGDEGAFVSFLLSDFDTDGVPAAVRASLQVQSSNGSPTFIAARPSEWGFTSNTLEFVFDGTTGAQVLRTPAERLLVTLTFPGVSGSNPFAAITAAGTPDPAVRVERARPIGNDPSPVPLPAGFGLLLTATALTGVAARRRRA